VGRISRSFQLVGQSYRLLMQDKELMVLPLISGVVMVIVMTAVILGFAVTGGLDVSSESRHLDAAAYIPMFIAYVLMYTVGIFFQAAVVAGATERMRGGDPTIASALNAATRKLGSIVAWAIVAATVGVILRAIQERVGLIGRIVVALLGAAWSLSTFFVVPVLVLEERTIGDSFKQSVSLFKKSWGESFVGGATIGIAAGCAWVTLVALVGILAYVIGFGALLVMAVGAVALMTFFSALQGVYLASLYRYATEGQVPPGFDKALLEQAFVPKKR
jgi:hypothetical protein